METDVEVTFSQLRYIRTSNCVSGTVLKLVEYYKKKPIWSTYHYLSQMFY